MFMPMPLEISRQLYEQEIVYRPPLEANNILIDVSFGCKWSHCTFCRESVAPRYRISDLDTVKRKIRLLAQLPGIQKHPHAFLLGEDVLAADMDYLCAILTEVRRSLPHVGHVSMYGRARDVLNKGEVNLRRLKDLGMGDIYMGVESGSSAILKDVLKGASRKTLTMACELMDSVGVPYACSSIIGLGGAERSEEHALQTADLYNSVHPKSIRIMTLTPVQGTVLYRQIEEGKVTELDPYQILLEERLFLEHLTLENCLLVGTHISNNVPLLGYLPEDKERMLAELDAELNTHDPAEWKKRDFENM